VRGHELNPSNSRANLRSHRGAYFFWRRPCTRAHGTQPETPRTCCRLSRGAPHPSSHGPRREQCAASSAGARRQRRLGRSRPSDTTDGARRVAHSQTGLLLWHRGARRPCPPPMNVGSVKRPCWGPLARQEGRHSNAPTDHSQRDRDLEAAVRHRRQRGTHCLARSRHPSRRHGQCGTRVSLRAVDQRQKKPDHIFRWFAGEVGQVPG